MAAYEVASITTLAEVKIAEDLNTTANSAIGFILDTNGQTAFKTRVANRLIIVNKTKFVLQIVAADTAVDTYENTPITTLAEILTAENLKVSADTKVTAVGDATSQTNFETRITNRTNTISAVKLTLEAAEKAVAAYEVASITTLAEVKIAEDLNTTANSAVASILIPNGQTAFLTRVTNRANTISAVKLTLQTAETAVAAYEVAPITTLAEVKIAEDLNTTANSAVASILAANGRTAFENRITNRLLVVDAAKNLLQIAAAELVIVKYESAPITSLAEITKAEELLIPAQTSVASVTDTTKKSEFENRILAKTSAIASAKTELQAQATAEIAVVKYEGASISSLNEVAAAEGLKGAADTAVLAVKDSVANASFTTRVDTQTTKIGAAKAELKAQIADARNNRTSGGGSYTPSVKTPIVKDTVITTPLIATINNPIVGEVLGAQSFKFTKSMKNGSKGDEVMELQKFLSTKGYYNGKADGKFGPKTKASLAKFQVANKLKGDGVVGSVTRAILNK